MNEKNNLYIVAFFTIIQNRGQSAQNALAADDIVEQTDHLMGLHTPGQIFNGRFYVKKLLGRARSDAQHQ